MAKNNDLGFDEDEDLFGFANPTATEPTEEEDLDIAEFLSTLDDSDASNIVELAGSTPSAPAALAAAPVAAAAAAGAAHTVLVAAPSGPFWRNPTVLAVGAIGALLLASNLFGAWITWKKSRSVVEEIEGVRLDLRATVENAKRDIQAETSRLEGLTQPRVSNQIGTVSFRTIEQHLELGDFETARRLVYGKLAIVDRQPPEERDGLEAHALQLLAEADRLEAASLAPEVDS
jgi:hypothetical protein